MMFCPRQVMPGGELGIIVLRLPGVRLNYAQMHELVRQRALSTDLDFYCKRRRHRVHCLPP
eukprot:COSAG01_NODE_6000_length_3908_cov_4.117616_2_plen_61_part_00